MRTQPTKDILKIIRKLIFLSVIFTRRTQLMPKRENKIMEIIDMVVWKTVDSLVLRCSFYLSTFFEISDGSVELRLKWSPLRSKFCTANYFINGGYSALCALYSLINTGVLVWRCCNDHLQTLADIRVCSLHKFTQVRKVNRFILTDKRMTIKTLPIVIDDS